MIGSFSYLNILINTTSLNSFSCNCNFQEPCQIVFSENFVTDFCEEDALFNQTSSVAIRNFCQ